MKKTGNVFLAIGKEIGEKLVTITKEAGIEVVGVLRRGDIHKVEEADTLICCQYDKIFSPQELSKFKRAINIHFSILPHNRGCLPINWAIWNNNPVGVTIHEMNHKIDDGDIIEQREINIDTTDTAYTAYIKCCSLTLTMYSQLMRQLVNGNYSTYKSNSISSSYHMKGEFPNGGYINKDWSEIDIDRFIRALTFPDCPKAKICIRGIDYELGYYNYRI